ncbi:hypothetical protein [Streptococcus sp. sy004]|uniref:hypothetical protein n=1 Tax=Streptococcus sp. sy004 TaxID=2600149 RepID=UPI0011B63FDF|nr:hypothetical protein [Streptococcus sp. sy004]TWT10976.1 hypothetical protein FRX54_03695 [Streptococcus sp. sy004]
MNSPIENFMRVYMFALEKHLQSKKEEIAEIPFQSDEANTDRPLKEYLKQEIESNFSSIPETFDIATVTTNTNNYNVKSLKNISINSVLLPDEISDEVKQNIKEKKQSIYTNPDLCFELNINNSIEYIPIELKSTKKNTIPGSSVQQIDPNEWVIFIKRSSTINITTGQYINAITTKIPFPDRSPRPEVSFDSLCNWNKKHRIVSNDNLRFNQDNDLISKQSIIYDWQSFLSNNWIDILFTSSRVKDNEPWFNNNLRKFILLFLDKYESLSKEQQSNFKNKVKNLIKK